MKRRVPSFIIALALCLNLCPVQAFAAGEGTGGGLCPHHPAHTDECGYVPDSPDALCTFACQICPVEDLIGRLPGGVSDDNSGQVQAQLSEIYALYDGLTADEQQQVDLSPCISLWEQLEGISPAALSDGLSDSVSSDGFYILDRDSEQQDPFEVSSSLEFNTAGYTFTGTGPAAIRVDGTGRLYLTGTVISQKGIGVEVLSGGFLSITEPNTSITSKTSYALDIASGAEVRLSAGTYSGRSAAIRTADNHFADLLGPGCAYFDGSSKLLLPAAAATAKVIVVGRCTGHSDEKTWTHTSGTTEHTWTCPYCGTVETEKCTFAFDQDGKGACSSCGNTLAIVVDGSGLANLRYDGTLKPGTPPPVTVTLGDGTVLTENTNYEVNYQPRTDASEITVTVTGITFNGAFTKTYHVEQDQPGISWDNTAYAVDYDGMPVDNLPNITITISASEDLHPYLQYFYRKTGDAAFTPGLPTNAGEYEVKAYIPESQNYKAAETNPYLTLTINKIPAVAAAPTAKTLTYNREAQELVTAGVLKPGAAAEGAVIEYARAQGGPYSTNIPTGVGVSNYDVYYRVAETENYSGVSETLVQNPNATSTYKSARINHKEITPTVELEYSTTLYTGGDKEPKVTVKDGEYIIPNSEYAVVYKDNRNVGTATVTVSNANNGNYKLATVEKKFQITSQPQAALSITSQPNTVIYGDKFTLGTQGGSGSGNVTWKITAGNNVARVDEHSGQVTVTGNGSFTVQATKSGKDPANANITNYDDATASWTVTAEKKNVTATVTAEDKFYGETYGGGDLKAAKVHAVVEQGVLPGDEITITGLTGAFSDENAGANKTVTVDMTWAVIGGTNFQHYAVTYSGLPVKAAIHKAVVHITTAPNAANLTYNGTAQALIDASVLAVDTSGVLVEYALSKDGLYSTAIPKGTNAGTYTVWYRVQETGNYTGLAPASVNVEISKKPVTPAVTLSGDGLTVGVGGTYSYIYDGSAKTPVVTVKDGDNVIPESDYTVTYSGNVNAGTAATVTVKSAAGGNYTFEDVPVNFEIRNGAAVLTRTPEAKDLTYNGTAQDLVTVGTATGGTVVYSSTGAAGSYSETIPQEISAGTYTVYYMVKGDANHDSTKPGQVSVTIKPKEITPKITLNQASYEYDGTAHTPTVTVEDGSDTIGASEYTVTYRDNTNAGTATVIVSDNNGGNYIVNGTATFEITRKAPVLTPPEEKENLQYNGAPQELVKAGVTNDGTVVYSVNGGNYSAAIPAAAAVGSYEIIYRVLGDANHSDTTPETLGPVTIAKNTVTSPAISLSSDTFRYNGSQQKPTVTVYDDNGLLIPEHEYTATIAPTTDGDAGIVSVGTYTVTITTPDSSNYVITTGNTRTFKIVPADQETISITGTQAQVRYGDVIQLGTTGGTGSGTVTWTVTGPGGSAVSSTISATGLLTVKNVGGPITVTAKRSAGGNYTDVSATWEFSAAKKQVTAVVTADDRPYAAGDKSATVHVSVPDSELVPGDSIKIEGVTGTFDDPNVGTSKKVTVNSTNPAPTVEGTNAENYEITYPATTTASITAKAASVDTDPTPNGLTYDASQAQELVTAGAVTGGIMVYSLDGTNFTLSIPKAKDAGTYTVYFKAQGDGNHTDSEVKSTPVTIEKQRVTPQVELTPSGAQYDGKEHKPTVTLRDSASNVIPASEYKVTYVTDSGANWTDKGNYTVRIEGMDRGNYAVATTQETFTISATAQNPLEITGKPGLVYYGDTFTLSAVGGSGSGAIHWSIEGSGIAAIDSNGVVTVKGTGGFTVQAYREAADGYSASNTASVPFDARPKPVTPTVTADDKPYDGTTSAVLHAVWKTGDLVGEDIIVLTVEGKFVTADAGTNKRVTVLSHEAIGEAADKYTITWPDSTTASIHKVDAKLQTAPGAAGLTYTGHPQDLLTSGATVGNIGTIIYSTSQNGAYSEVIPTGTNAGTYTVWYKVADSVNYTGIPAAAVEVKIARAEPHISSYPTASGAVDQKLSNIPFSDGTANVPGTFAWADGSIEAESGVAYDVIFTPDDLANYVPVTIKVVATGQTVSGSPSITPASRPGISGTAANTLSTPAQTATTVQNGTASTVVSAADGSKLVQGAMANQSRNVVIKPEIAGSVTKSAVSIPSSTVSQLGSKTDAALTVSSPVADVTIPNAALGTLGRAGGTVNVVTEQVEQSVVLTLAAGGKTVEQVPGGVTLTVPVENAGPGTVAVLVHEDGTRETVRKSVVDDGVMSIPLSGSATVEIVDNSTDFTDVPPESWAADAVDFASSHELFSGTSETTFSPDQTMSRGMLATVLYRLEGSPDLDLTDAFLDVSDDAWYAEGVAWAVENNIVDGYGDGQFGPDDDITREQFVVMLWRYAGSPRPGSQVLDFVDADQASSFALEALCWAVKNGILHGVGGGALDPGGTATRAQAAQLLKNFMENT